MQFRLFTRGFGLAAGVVAALFTATLAPPAGAQAPGGPHACLTPTIFVAQGVPTQLEALRYGAGSATFESTTSQRNESLSTMTYEFRRLVQNGSTDNFLYKFWYYDVTGKRQLDHFSCELNPGWVSNGACWNNGS